MHTGGFGIAAMPYDNAKIALKLTLCENLYAQSGAVKTPYFKYKRNTAIATGDSCAPGHGVSFQRRTSTGGSSTPTTLAAVSAPEWVRLKRSGSSLTAWHSGNGSSWTQISSDTIVGVLMSMYGSL
jgi:hypothetical protein